MVWEDVLFFDKVVFDDYVMRGKEIENAKVHIQNTE